MLVLRFWGNFVHPMVGKATYNWFLTFVEKKTSSSQLLLSVYVSGSVLSNLHELTYTTVILEVGTIYIEIYFEYINTQGT